ncbi:GNAT family N-acetyltransferase [Haloferax namakaokahaiae]|uniref:GNAT family N-acetyltransferase n=1 Tax=Haloferax namakaokahaiae TaxID=1748331 RepID=A0ABD5ZC92_9EURY
MSVRKVLEDEAGSDDAYEIRWYQPRDRAAFMDLYELAFNQRSEAWFSWKYEQNPYAERVPIILADKDGEIAGLRPFIPLPLRVGDQTYTAHQLVDLVVHPDHRRQGLMTRMSRWMNAAIWDDSAATFTYANPPAHRGLMKMTSDHWTNHDLGTFVRYERLNDISAFLTADHPLSVRLGAAAIEPYYKVKHRVQDRLADDGAELTVTRTETVPISTLTQLYERAPPTAAHILRDETFYQWRFSEPDRQFVTYVAERDSTPVAAIVVGTSEHGGSPSTAELVEVLPLNGGDDAAGAFSALLSEITDDFASNDHICASCLSIPHEVFAAHGFTRTDEFPLSKFVDETTFIVCPLGGLSDEATKAQLTEDGSWTMSYCVRLLG